MHDLISLALWYLLRVLAALLYFLPTIVASQYRHPRWFTILFLNILVGWTFVGWIIVLWWTLQASKRSGFAERS